jgi:hypothetical protein
MIVFDKKYNLKHKANQKVQYIDEYRCTDPRTAAGGLYSINSHSKTPRRPIHTIEPENMSPNREQK